LREPGGEAQHKSGETAFVMYVIVGVSIMAFMLVRIVPKYGARNMLVYITICSFGGSLLVIASKGVGVAVKLTLAGNNQFLHLATYCFFFAMIFGIVFQLNYLNKVCTHVLSLFPHNHMATRRSTSSRRRPSRQSTTCFSPPRRLSQTSSASRALSCSRSGRLSMSVWALQSCV